MVVVLDSGPRPLVEVALSRGGDQLHLWDSRMDYESAPLVHRLLGFGTVIGCEGLYICSEIGPFESHPILNRLLTRPELFKKRWRRRDLLQGWGSRSELALIERAAGLIGKGYNASVYRERLMDVLDTPLPRVSRYSLDGGRTWRHLLDEHPELPLLDGALVA